MTNGSAYVIEVGDLAAGIVVREDRRYRFYASHARFRTLDGAVFRRPMAAWRAARSILSRAGGDLAPRGGLARG